MSSQQVAQARVVIQGWVGSVNGPSDGLLWQIGFLHEDGLVPLSGQQEILCGIDEALEWGGKRLAQFTGREHGRAWFPLDDTGTLWATNVDFPTT